MTVGTSATIDTIASLRANSTSISSPYTFDVQGYGSIGDGGGGIFCRVPSGTPLNGYGAVFIGSVSGNVLTITSFISGPSLAHGQVISNNGLPSSVYVVSGVNPTYILSENVGTIASGTMTADDGGTLIVDLAGNRWQRQFVWPISAKWFGAAGNNSSDDTAPIHTALAVAAGATFYGVTQVAVPNNARAVILPNGTYLVDGISLVNGVALRGEGVGSVIKLNAGANADVISVPSDVSGWTLQDLVIDGNAVEQTEEAGTNNTSGHGINLSAAGTSNPAMSALIDNVFVQNCAQDGLYQGLGSLSDLIVENFRVTRCLGYGINITNVNDSKFGKIDIRQNQTGGIFTNCANTHWGIVKVWQSRLSSYPDTIGMTNLPPLASTAATDQGAVIICGNDQQFAVLEIQENACIGLQLGTAQYSCAGLTIACVLVDGNGGFVGSTNIAYQRNGIFVVNAYKCKINGVCDDFRARAGYGRQNVGLNFIQTTPTFNSSSTLITGNFYQIADNSGGADFTNIQASLGTPSNAVGLIFQAQVTGFGAATPTSWGTGSLRAVNDYCEFNLLIINQYDQLQGINNGYSLLGAGAHIYGQLSGNAPYGPVLLPGLSLPNVVSSVPNAMTWYEQGTALPTVVGTGTAGVGTYTSRNTSYQRIGNRVNFDITMAYSATTGTGNITVATGIPYGQIDNPGVCAIYSLSGLAYTGPMLCAYVFGTNIIIKQVDNTGAESGVPLPAAATFLITGSYQVA